MTTGCRRSVAVGEAKRRHPSAVAWRPDLAAMATRMADRMASDGRPWAAFAAAVLVGRAESGLGQADFAELLGVSVERLERMEQGWAPPSSGPERLAREVPWIDWRRLGACRVKEESDVSYDGVVAQLRAAVEQLEAAGITADDPDSAARCLVAVDELASRLRALALEGAAALAEAGLVQLDVDGKPFRIEPATSWKWDMPTLLTALKGVAAESGRSEAELVLEACSVTSGKVTGVRGLGLDPDEFREQREGAVRLVRPK